MEIFVPRNTIPVEGCGPYAGAVWTEFARLRGERITQLVEALSAGKPPHEVAGEAMREDHATAKILALALKMSLPVRVMQCRMAGLGMAGLTLDSLPADCSWLRAVSGKRGSVLTGKVQGRILSTFPELAPMSVVCASLTVPIQSGSWGYSGISWPNTENRQEIVLDLSALPSTATVTSAQATGLWMKLAGGDGASVTGPGMRFEHCGESRVAELVVPPGEAHLPDMEWGNLEWLADNAGNRAALVATYFLSSWGGGPWGIECALGSVTITYVIC
jgi:hypothetical protein